MNKPTRSIEWTVWGGLAVVVVVIFSAFLVSKSGRWHFLTGKKIDLYRLATKGLLLVLEEVKPEQRQSENDLFVHSTLFVVVDKQGRIRASFEGLEPSSRQKILQAIEDLLKEK